MDFFDYKVSAQAKALVASVAAGVAVAIAGISDAIGDGQFTSSDAVSIVLSVLAVYGITFKVPNK